MKASDEKDRVMRTSYVMTFEDIVTGPQKKALDKLAKDQEQYLALREKLDENYKKHQLRVGSHALVISEARDRAAKLIQLEKAGKDAVRRIEQSYAKGSEAEEAARAMSKEKISERMVSIERDQSKRIENEKLRHNAKMRELDLQLMQERAKIKSLVDNQLISATQAAPMRSDLTDKFKQMKKAEAVPHQAALDKMKAVQTNEISMLKRVMAEKIQIEKDYDARKADVMGRRAARQAARDKALIAQMNAAIKDADRVLRYAESVEARHTRFLEVQAQRRAKNAERSARFQVENERRRLANIEKSMKREQQLEAARQKQKFSMDKLMGALRGGGIGGIIGGIAGNVMGGMGGGAMGGALGPIISSMSKLGLTGKAVAVALSGVALATIGMKKAFTDAVKYGTEFEKALSNVRAVLQTGDKELDAANVVKLEAYARQLGKTSVFTAKEAADAFSELAKIGYSTNEILASGKDVLDLAAATGETMQESALVTSRTIKQFGLSASDTKDVVDQMTLSFARSALDMRKFSESMSYAGPLARGAGASFTETTASLAVMADRGIDASKAGTALRMMFVKLSDSSSLASKMVKKVAPEAKSFSDKMAALATLNLNPTGVKKLFGQYASAGAQALLAANDAYKDFVKDFAKNSKDFANNTARLQMDNLAGDLKMLQSAWEEFSIALNKAFQGGMRSAVQDLVSAFRELSNWMKDHYEPLSSGVRAIATGFSLAVDAMKLIVKPIGAAIEALDKLYQKVQEISGDKAGSLRGPSVTSMKVVNDFEAQRKTYKEELEKTKSLLNAAKIEESLYDGMTSDNANRARQQARLKIGELTGQVNNLNKALSDGDALYKRQQEAFSAVAESRITEAEERLKFAQAAVDAQGGKASAKTLTELANSIKAKKELIDLIAYYKYVKPAALPGMQAPPGDNELEGENEKKGGGRIPVDKTLYWYEMLLGQKKWYYEQAAMIDEQGWKTERKKAINALEDKFGEEKTVIANRIKEIKDRIAVDAAEIAKGNRTRSEEAMIQDVVDYAELQQLIVQRVMMEARVRDAIISKFNVEYDLQTRLFELETKRAKLAIFGNSVWAKENTVRQDQADALYELEQKYTIRKQELYERFSKDIEQGYIEELKLDEWKDTQRIKLEKETQRKLQEIRWTEEGGRRASRFEATSARLGASSGNLPSALSMVDADTENKKYEISMRYVREFADLQDEKFVNAQLYSEKLTELEARTAAQMHLIDVEAANAKYELMRQEIEKYKQVFDTVRETQQIYHQMEMDRIEQRYEKEMKKVENLRNARVISDRTARVMERQAERRKEAAQKRAMEKEKAWAKAAAIMNYASAVIGTWAGYAKFGPFGTAAAVAQTLALSGLLAAQIQQIDAQKMATGGFPTGKNAMVQMNERGQEAVLNASATRRLGRRTINDLNAGRAVDAAPSNNTTVTQTFIYSPSHNFETSAQKVDVFQALREDREQFANLVSDSRRRGYKL